MRKRGVGRPRKPTRHDAIEAVYKIRRRSDGLYSTGGTTPIFKKYGKSWTNVAHVKSHLRGIRGGVYDDCVLVVFVLQESGEPISVKEWIDKMRLVDAL